MVSEERMMVQDPGDGVSCPARKNASFGKH
jgi:hypothetical protein